MAAAGVGRGSSGTDSCAGIVSPGFGAEKLFNYFVHYLFLGSVKY